MSEDFLCGKEVIGQVSDEWLDEERFPAGWLFVPDDDPGQDNDPGRDNDPGQDDGCEPSPVAAGPDSAPSPAAHEDPLLPDEEPWWLTDEFCGTPEEEHAAWLASLPADIRADYLTGPYTEPGEAFAPGFTHHDGGGPSGPGFAAGGVLDQMPPEPWLAQALAEATEPGYHELSDSEQIGVLCGWQRLAAWAQAGLAAAALAVARRREVQAVTARNRHLSEHVPDEIAAALALTALSAGRLLAAAAGLGRLPEVAAALSAGQIDWPKACILTDELSVLDEELARGIATQLLAAGRLTTSQLRARLRRAVLAADPAAADRRKKEGRKDTRVEVWDEPSGNTVLAGRELAPADAIAADAQLTADAHWLRRRGTPGTLAELRAAVFIARLSGRDLASLLPGCADLVPGCGERSADADGTCGEYGAAGSGHRAAGEPVAGPGPGGIVNLTMPLSAYAGLDDSPGEAAGYGATDARTCRDLAGRISGTARWCLTLTGPDGRAVAHACARPGHAPEPASQAIRWAAGLRERLQFLETGACTHRRQVASYAWPSAVRHLIEIRQWTCTAPGCRRAARRCDIDHTTPFDKGGRTCECNGAPLCRKHHRCKQTPGWHLTQDYPGVLTWRLPGGREYRMTGEPYPV
jgi:hypothetical protein